jgi:glycine/D-amino acid oxidase-like deaminating enzyme
MAMLAEEAGARIILGSVDAIGYGAADDNPLEGKSFEEEKIGMLPDLHVSHGNGVQSVTYTDKATSESRSIPADIVVLAAGPWTPVLFPAAPISSLRAHSITIRLPRPVSPYCLFTHIPVPPKDVADDDGTNPQDTTSPSGAAKIMSPEIYSRPNNEVYVCGSGDNDVPLPADTDAVEISRQHCQNIADAVASISDELRDGIVTSRRSCYLPTVDVGGSGGPLVGETGIPGLLLAAGHSCWGIHNATGTGKLISEMIFDGEAISADIRGLDPQLVI